MSCTIGSCECCEIAENQWIVHSGQQPEAPAKASPNRAPSGLPHAQRNDRAPPLQPAPQRIDILTHEQLEQQPRLKQQLLDLNAAVFGAAADGLQSELLRTRAARVAVAYAGTGAPAAAESGSSGDDGGGGYNDGSMLALEGFVLYHTNSMAAHIVRIGVAPRARRRGLGTALLRVSRRLLSRGSRCSHKTSPAPHGPAAPLTQHAPSFAHRRARQAALRRAVHERHVTCAALHVEPSNAAAVRMYRRTGFEAEATVPDYYDAGRPAVRMTLDDVGGWLAAAGAAGGRGGGGGGG